MFVVLVCEVNELNVFCLLEDVSTSSLSSVIYIFVSFDVFYSVALGLSQTIGKLTGGSWVVRFGETLYSEFFAIVTMSCTDFIMSKTLESNGLQEFTAFKACRTPPFDFIFIYHSISNSKVELGSSLLANFN